MDKTKQNRKFIEIRQKKVLCLQHFDPNVSGMLLVKACHFVNNYIICTFIAYDSQQNSLTTHKKNNLSLNPKDISFDYGLSPPIKHKKTTESKMIEIANRIIRNTTLYSSIEK